MPAKAGTQPYCRTVFRLARWAPAFAGVTALKKCSYAGNHRIVGMTNFEAAGSLSVQRDVITFALV